MSPRSTSPPIVVRREELDAAAAVDEVEERDAAVSAARHHAAGKAACASPDSPASSPSAAARTVAISSRSGKRFSSGIGASLFRPEPSGLDLEDLVLQSSRAASSPRRSRPSCGP